MKKVTLGILNCAYGLFCSLLFLLQNGAIAARGFDEGQEYLAKSAVAWLGSLLVVLILSVVLICLNIRREDKGNKVAYGFLYFFIAVNMFGIIFLQRLAVFSFLIVLFGANLILQYRTEEKFPRLNSKLRKRQN